MDGVTDEDFYRAVNIVRPNLIRVESDEATYNLHIMLRFDLERAMIRGDLAVADLPGAWNDRIKSDLGLDVPDAARGCLQDVHWSMGSVGYFPTYTLGNLCSAQLWDAVGVAIPDVDQRMQRGEFATLLGWLRDNVTPTVAAFRPASSPGASPAILSVRHRSCATSTPSFALSTASNPIHHWS